MNVVQVIIGSGVYTWGGGVLLSGQVRRASGSRASSASFTLTDPQRRLLDTVPLPFSRDRVEVWAGAGVRPQLIFTGAVTRLGWEDGRLEIQAADKSTRLRRGQRAKNRANTTLAAVAKELAKEEGLTLDLSQAGTEAQSTRWASVLQHGETDWELLERLAALTGHTVEVTSPPDSVWQQWQDTQSVPLDFEDRPDVLVVRSLLREPDGRALRLSYGGGLLTGIRYDVERKLPTKTGKVTSKRGQVVGEDVGDASARNVLTARTGVSAGADDDPALDDQPLDATRVAAARKRRTQEARFELASLPSDLRMGMALEVLGYGVRLSGIWIVDGYTVGLGDLRTAIDAYNSGA